MGMKKNSPQDPGSPAPKPARGGLRLVHDAAAKPKAEPVVEGAPKRRQSVFAQFMNAYADSIDQDIRVLLEV